MNYTYQTKGVCSTKIDFEVEDGVVKDVAFSGGCNGNLKGIAVLVAGLKVEDVIAKLEHLTCGGKGTSCPAQLALALKEVY